MAILHDHNLSFEFIFREVDECLWLKYEIYFRWNNEYVFRDNILKRSPSGWAGRSEGALCAGEFNEDSFLPVLEMAVNAVEPVCWEPTEPDVKIAFYPDRHFPFISDNKKEIYVADDIAKQREERRRRKAANHGRLPDDVVTMMVYIDAYNFKDCPLYYGTGFSMVLAPTRSNLARFHQDLKREYEEFVTQERLREKVAEQRALLHELFTTLERKERRRTKRQWKLSSCVKK